MGDFDDDGVTSFAETAGDERGAGFSWVGSHREAVDRPRLLTPDVIPVGSKIFLLREEEISHG